MDNRVYERPTGGAMIADLITLHPDKGHPRILFTRETMDTFRKNVAENAFMAQKWALVQRRADAYLTQEPWAYEKMRHRLTVHEKVQETMLCLSMAWVITKEEQYAKRLWQEIYNCCVIWPNWNPYHFIDTGIISLGLAVAYDWLYDYWSAQQREIMENAIMDRAVATILEDYLDLPRERASGVAPGWLGYGNNWSFLCSANIMAAVAAICDEREEYLPRCAAVLQYGLREMEQVLSTYGPDGGYIEGPHYWGVANTYLAYFGMTLVSAFGRDYGIFSTPGLEATGFFNYDMMGPGGSFNFSDGPASYAVFPESLWFARQFRQPAVQAMYRMAHDQLDVCGKNTMTYFKELLYYSPEMEQFPFAPPQESYYRRVETVTIRDSWDMGSGYFVGLHAGENGIAHYHMDCGTFVLDMNGKRFAQDLGYGTYGEPGLWFRYRYSAQGHNTWVINPNERDSQNPKAKTAIVGHDFAGEIPWAIADISDAYEDVIQLRRGILAAENRRVFLVQDEIKTKFPSEAYWQMHTSAEIDILPGGKQAVLTLEDDCVLVSLLTENNAVFEVHPAMPYPGTPYFPVSDSDEATPKLILHFSDLEETQVGVEFRYFPKGTPLPTAHLSVYPLTLWDQHPDDYYILGLEPGNCYPDGRAAMGEQGKLKFLQPGERETYRIKIRLEG